MEFTAGGRRAAGFVMAIVFVLGLASWIKYSDSYHFAVYMPGIEYSNAFKYAVRNINTTHVFDKLTTLPYYYKAIVTRNNDKHRQRLSYNHSWSDLRNKTVDKHKLILFYNRPGWCPLGLCRSGIAKCPIKSCTCLEGRGRQFQADAVIIDLVNLADRNPPRRYPNQVWISFGLEAPMHYNGHNYESKQWRHGVFNWTMTYRLDSDVVLPYDVLIRLDDVPNRNFTEIALRKSKSAAWMVTNCKTPSKRDQYVKELQKYYTVDIYGQCGTFKCSRNIEGECKKLLEEQYYFYLAFENALCEDYITEKLFKTFDLDIVPVVRGGADYESMLPSGTYINTADFTSPRELGKHLLYLQRNVTAYSEILRRKSQYLQTAAAQKPSPMESAYCDICMKLHNLDKYSNSYHDNVLWLRNGTCHPPRDFS